MKVLVTVAVLASLATPAVARKSCEELKSEIEAKLKAKGVTNYTLEIKSTDEMKDLKEGKIIGSCEGGTKKIVYARGKRRS